MDMGGAPSHLSQCVERRACPSRSQKWEVALVILRPVTATGSGSATLPNTPPSNGHWLWQCNAAKYATQ